MNPKYVFNLFSSNGKGQTAGPRQITSLAISLGMLSLFALTACGQVSASVPVVEEASPALAPVIVTEMETASDSAFLAANPELLKAHPPVVVQALTEAEFLAANPELKIVRRYAGTSENVDSQPNAYIIEVVRAQNYTAFREKNSLDAFLEANPELRFARSRLAAATENGDDSTVLASNPELKVVRRYMDGIEANAIDAVKPTIELEVIREQTTDFWIDALSRNYNGQAETPR